MSLPEGYETPRWLVHLEALAARVAYGIDTTRPGWLDEYERQSAESDRALDEALGPQHGNYASHGNYVTARPRLTLIEGGRDA